MIRPGLLDEIRKLSLADQLDLVDAILLATVESPPTLDALLGDHVEAELAKGPEALPAKPERPVALRLVRKG